MSAPAWRPSIRRRLIFGYAAVVGLFALASALSVVTMFDLAASFALDAELDQAKHDGHNLAMGVGEMMLAQERLVHGEPVRIETYGAARDRARELATELDARLRHSDAGRHAAAIATLVGDIDAQFRRQVLPSIHNDRLAESIEHLATARGLADDLARHNEALLGALERESAAAGASAARLAPRAALVVLACLGSALLVAAALGAHLTRSIARPLRALGEGAQRIARGDLEAVIRVPGRDELAELAAALNTMARDLHGHQDELVEARKLASVGRLAAGVAHEINNPLGVIQGHVRLLQEGRYDEPEAKDALETIRLEVQQCKSIVDDLLNLARPLRRTAGGVDLVALARDTVDRAAATAPAGVGVAFSRTGPGVVDGDPVRMRQLLQNLVRNAIEACGANGRVVVIVGPLAAEPGVLDDRPGTVEVSVVDDGCGLSPEQLAQVFEPFVTHRADGTGLGLFVAQAIARAHGGRIVATSKPGQGSRFRLALPLLEPREGDA